ncbi:MAG: response regulator transcription factor [Planctomycetales bacterium]|nr:response regulator transcription factor [Planctomycetales bacterium]
MNTLSNIRILLADDHTMVRESLARVLESSGAITVVGETGDSQQMLEMVGRLKPDMVILDYSMPNHDPASQISELLRIYSRLKILVLTVHQNIQYAVRVLEHGAHGYLIKSAAVEELVDAIKSICAGSIYLSAELQQEVLLHMRRPRSERLGLDALSPREFDFLRLFAGGKSLQQCARSMDISISTASTYRARILDKLNLKTNSELIRFALEHDIVQ